MDKGYLCYLWFGNNSNIDELGLNFDTDYYFTIERERNDFKTVIKITEHSYTNPIPRNFFGNTISALTTIVGENGAGKSSVLRFILNNLLTGTVMGGEYYIALFKIRNEYKIAHNFIGEIRFVDKNKKENTFGNERNEKADVMKFYDSVLSISNIFDGYKERYKDLSEYQSFTVISTLNCLINEAFQFKDSNRINDYYKNDKVFNPIYECVIDDTLEYLSNGDFNKLFSGEFVGFPNGLSFDIANHRFSDKINELYNDFTNNCVENYRETTLDT